MNYVYQSDLLNPDGSAPFRNPQYIRVNLGIGGTGGDASAADFPTHYVIDYVRVYQP